MELKVWASQWYFATSTAHDFQISLSAPTLLLALLPLNLMVELESAILMKPS
jgi:hypothetical protein